MENTLLEKTGLLIVTRCWCGVQHGVPESLYRMVERQHNSGEAQTSIYCPLGHQWSFSGEPNYKKLERQLANTRAQLDQAYAAVRDERESRRATQRRLSATQGVVTRTKNRIANGVCPCCKRHFKDLHRHMAGQHPNYTTAE